MTRTKSLLVLMLMLSLATVARASLRCDAQVDRTQVRPGGQIVLVFNVEGDVRQQPEHSMPRIQGVEFVSGGTSQSFSVGGGKSKISVSSTYYLKVRRQSGFTIPPVTFRSQGQTCSTEPITIKVDAAAIAPGQTGNRTPPPSTGTKQSSSSSSSRSGSPGDPYFITLSLAKDEVWVGEQVVLIFRYHRRQSSWDQPTYTPPRTEGFWRVDLPPERNYRKSVDGHVYDITEIRYALFPTKAGQRVIEAASVTLPGDPFNRLFGRRGRGPRQLVTDPIAVTVKDLPLPRPPRFSGIVADRVEFTATVDRDTVPRGEPVSLALSVVADGFLKSFEGFVVPEIKDLQIHDAAENLRETVDGPRYEARFRQEKAMVPTLDGTISLPPLELTYFDPGKGTFATVSASVPPLVVTPSDLPVAGDDPSGFRRSEIARLGRDLAFIHPLQGSPGRDGNRLPAQILWWVVLLAPWGLLGLYRHRLHRQAVDRRDPVGQRRRTAWPRARQDLQKLTRDGNPADLARVILTFVSDRSGRASAGLTGRDVRAWAEGLNKPDEAGKLAAILEQCDSASFGGATEMDVPQMAREVEMMLGDLDKASARRKGGKSVTSLAGLLMFLMVVTGFSAPAQDLPPAAGSSPGVDPARLVAEGNQAYTDGDLEMALTRYRAAMAQGAGDADLHYNLGNTYARRGDLGQAIACYLRAQRRAPRDRDIRTNLTWVRSHTKDLELVGGSLPPVIAQLDTAVHQLSVDEWALILVLLSWLMAGLVAWSWRRGWLASGSRRVLILLGALLALSAVVLATRWYEEEIRDTAVIIAEEVEVRSGPATTFPVVFQIHDGLTLVVRDQRDDWVQIGLGGDWVGWVPEGVLERVQGR